MKIEEVPFSVTDWKSIPTETIEGENGSSEIKSFEQGNLRTRIVEYSRDYIADHWCLKGHVVYVIDGCITIEIKDGRKFELVKGMSFQVADCIDAHKAYTKKGAKVFIVD